MLSLVENQEYWNPIPNYVESSPLWSRLNIQLNGLLNANIDQHAKTLQHRTLSIFGDGSKNMPCPGAPCNPFPNYKFRAVRNDIVERRSR